MATLYGVGLSPFVRKVRVLLAEKGIAHEHDPVVPFNVSPEYKQMTVRNLNTTLKLRELVS